MSACFANDHEGPCDDAVVGCDNCWRMFCDEHGQHGGDYEGVARPDICERCRIESDLEFSSKVSPDRKALYDATTTYLRCGSCHEEYAGDQSPSFVEGTGICGPCMKRQRQWFADHQARRRAEAGR